MNSTSDLPGAVLSFGVTGAGVAIDPATGVLSILAAALREGIEVTVTATGADGTPAGRFRLAVTVVPEGAGPALEAAPALPGVARIGEPVVLDPGTWSGDPAPVLAFQWRRDGADIADATAGAYVPGPEDDLRELSCRVGATNAVGSAEAETAALIVTYAAPMAAGGLADLVLERGTPPAQVAAAADFAGAGLVFAVSGAGAAIDSATGLVTIATDALLDDEPITVTAANSGGSATSSFRVRVAAAAEAPALLVAPALAGTGRIGTAVTVEPGSWSGNPAPEIALQWLCDGADIALAVAPHYTPGSAGDGMALACRVTATNPAGTAEVVTAPLTITQAPPAVIAALPDLAAEKGDAALKVEAAQAFDGAALVFAVTGAVAAIDPATGRIDIPTDTLRDAEPVTVSASNSGGTAAASFAVTISAPAFVPVAPVLVTAPALAGSAKIGQALTVEPGVWGGAPAPALAFQWLADGAEIAGADGADYKLAPADDLKAIACRVTAANAGGSAEAVTVALTVTYVAPMARGGLSEEIFDQGTGDQIVDAATDFTGENLTFSVTGAGAGIDPATGRVTVPTDEAVADRVTVTAMNSGGGAESSFQVTVEADEDTEVPAAPGAADWTIAYIAREGGHQMVFRWLDGSVEIGTDPVDGWAGLAWTFSDAERASSSTQGQLSRSKAYIVPAGTPAWDINGDEIELDDATVFLQLNHAGKVNSPIDRSNQIGNLEDVSIRISTDNVVWAEMTFSGNSDVKEDVEIPDFSGATPPVGHGDYQSFGLDMDAPWIASGKPPCDGEQASTALHWCEADTDRIYHHIDVSVDLQVSLNQGKHWQTLKSRGRAKRSWGLFGLAADPFNADRIIGINSRIWTVMDVGAIWLSTDGGINWSPRWSPTDGRCVGYQSRDRVSVCFDPGSYNAGLGYCTRVYAQTTHDYNNSSTDMLGRNRLLRSSDGGLTWAVIWADNMTTPAMGNDFNGIKLMPNDDTKILCWGSKSGIFSNIKSGTSASPAFFSGIGSGANGRPYVSGDGQTIVLASGNDLWRSINAGSSFSRRNSDFVGSLTHAWVSPADPNKVIAYRHITGLKEWYYSTNGGVNFTKSTMVESGSKKRYQVMGSTNMLAATWHPTDPNKFVFANVSKPYFTTNGGQLFTAATGMGGVHFKGWAPQAFDHPTDPNKFIFGVHDRVGFRTIDGGESFEPLGDFRAHVGTVEDNSFCTVVNPFDGKTLLMQVGREPSGELVRCADIWKTNLSTADFTIVDTSSKARNGTCWDPLDQNIAYSSDRKSTDKGVTWANVTVAVNLDLDVMGAAADGATTVLYYCKQNQGNLIYKSLNRGATLTQVWSGWKTSIGFHTPFDIDPTAPHTIYLPGDPTKPATSHIVKVNTSTGAVTHINILGGASITSERWQIMNILCDKHPGTGATIIYVRTFAVDTGQVLFMSVNGGTTWTDISAGWSTGSDSNSMRLQRSTGLLFVGSATGLYVRQPPYTSPVRPNFFDKLRARATTNSWMPNHLEAYP